jgi:hypothetical protein
MSSHQRNVLTLAGLFVLGIAVLHVACAIVGPAAYRYFGAGEQMASWAAAGSPVPAVVTLLLALVFGLFGVYALSAAGRFRPLPVVRPVVIAIGSIFALRGLAVVLEIVKLVREPESIPVREPVFSAVALVVGAAYLVGALGWRTTRSGGSRQT